MVTGRFFKRTHDLEVNTLQALVLLLFNDEKERSPADVAGAVDFPQEVANRVLHSLACGKFQILRKSPPGRAIKASDTFQPNPKFSSSLRKIRVPLAALESAHSAKKIQHDRRCAPCLPQRPRRTERRQPRCAWAVTPSRPPLSES